jgi:hypothetical protein
MAWPKMRVEFHPGKNQQVEVPIEVLRAEIPVLKPRECLKPEKEFEGGKFMKAFRGKNVKKGCTSTLPTK